MNFIKNLFGKKDAPAQPALSYHDFWTWFKEHEQTFYEAVKDRSKIEAAFFNKLAPKLLEIKEGFFFLAGMVDETRAELILTPDGSIRNMVFVEELAAAAPPMPNWLITALKPAMSIDDISIRMEGYEFHKGNMHFHVTTDPDRPDNIDITIIHDDLNAGNRPAITNGCYIFLDNFLGELNFVSMVDVLRVESKDSLKPGTELIPMHKLKDYLAWREKEFVEKYEGTRRTTDEDSYSMLQAQLESGNMLLAVVNTNLLRWDAKASHPWLMTVTLEYNGENNGGMPDKDTLAELEQVEENIIAQLKDTDGYLNIGRQTAENSRELYFSCKDFRKPSKVLHRLIQTHTGNLKITYDIYKDKYWQSFDRFMPQ